MLIFRPIDLNKFIQECYQRKCHSENVGRKSELYCYLLIKIAGSNKWNIVTDSLKEKKLARLNLILQFNNNSNNVEIEQESFK